MGVLIEPLARAPSGRIDRERTITVRLTTGELSSQPWAEVLNGGNLAAVGDGSSATWELLQFQSATLIAPRTWVLSGLLRGQLGSDAVGPAEWAAGSWFVRIDGGVRQIALDASERRLARHYRIGPSRRGYDDPSYQHVVAAFDGIGLRPLSPAHLRQTITAAGRSFSWVRRTRINGDSWEFEEVPLGEAFERYRVQVVQAGGVVRQAEVAAPGWDYTTGQMAADGLSGAAEIRVAQISDSFGAGPAAILPLTF
jgi:hypothetical protein